MYKQFTINQNRRYIDIIDGLVNQYNNKIHKGINNLTPDSIYNNIILIYLKILIMKIYQNQNLKLMN